MTTINPCACHHNADGTEKTFVYLIQEEFEGDSENTGVTEWAFASEQDRDAALAKLWEEHPEDEDGWCASDGCVGRREMHCFRSGGSLEVIQAGGTFDGSAAW